MRIIQTVQNREGEIVEISLGNNVTSDLSAVSTLANTLDNLDELGFYITLSIRFEIAEPVQITN